jgi:thioredoxin-like negative regulator of GroEL
MDRLTVPHEYDPETGFIVAKRTVKLPPEIGEAPQLDQAVAIAASERRIVIAFATADRCAPCQQFKKDALNDPRVIERLGDPRLIATHVEVDRSPEVAEQYLGGRAIPMTYALRDGECVAELRGQRSAEELLAWLDDVAPRRP